MTNKNNMEKKQTAVEYVIDILHKMGIIEHINDPLVEQIRNEALAMEREQIEEAYRNGENDEFRRWLDKQTY